MSCLCVYETRARLLGFAQIAGVDEAGRGPLAGPIVAAACIVPEHVSFQGIQDSKKLSSSRREFFYHAILNEPGVIYGIGIVSSCIIDQINILQATLRAMLKAVQSLPKRPDYILVDGNQAPHFGIPTQTIIRGDSLSQSIMAAAILAKYIRDLLMQEYHLRWPQYGFDAHKGYGTKAHLKALEKGPCPLHRKTFAPLNRRS